MRDNVGLLMPISSLPGNHGIGDFGNSCFSFIAWLSKHHYRYWQVLPISPVDSFNSPYNTTCSVAIDYRYISLDALVGEGYLKSVEQYRSNSPYVNYEKVGLYKKKFLYKAYLRYSRGDTSALKKFKTRHPWVMKYATFEVFRELNDDKVWSDWNIEQRDYFLQHSNPPKTYLKRINFYIFLQFIAHNQWHHVLAYAREKNIRIISDLPFYCCFNSVDCWINRSSFKIDENNKLKVVAAIGPDAFNQEGKFLGNPVYDFDKEKQDDYEFIVNRIGETAELYNILRLDYFRCFDSYYEVSTNFNSVKQGNWLDGPKKELLEILFKKYPDINVFVDDLGDVPESTFELRNKFNLKGMQIISYVLLNKNIDVSNEYLYTGTQDSETLYGWLKGLTFDSKKQLLNKFKCRDVNLFNEIIKYTLSLESYVTIISIQDLLKLDNKYRVNVPYTKAVNNFSWRIKEFTSLNKAKFKIK